VKGFVVCFALLFLHVHAVSQQQSVDATKAHVIVAEVRLVGGESLSTEERNELQKRASGNSDRASWMEELKLQLERYLADEGYLKAEIELGAVPTAQGTEGRVVLTVKVRENKRFKIAQIWWRGESILGLSQLSDTITVRTGDVLRPTLLMKSAELIQADCLAKGFPNAMAMPQWQLQENGRASVYIQVNDCGRSQSSQGGLAEQSMSARESCKVLKSHVPAKFPITTYDAHRDGASDLADAKVEASASRRRILMIVGGNWCGWCKVLEQAFDKNLAVQRDTSFVSLHVNYSDENRNDCVLRELPKATGYPYVYVLDAAGNVLHSNDTTAWQFAKGYDKVRLAEFLTRWSGK
jgi:hypothetical protein